ncbi:MAG: DUF1800 family protein [Gemmatimonadota bacterium]
MANTTGSAASRSQDSAAVLHLLRRATFGVRERDVEEVLAIGRDAWLDRQLHPERIDDSALEARLALFPAATLTQTELWAAYPSPQRLRARLGGRGETDDSLSAGEIRRELRRLREEMGVQPPGRILFDLAGAKLQRAVYSERQLQEVMTDFWFNHFNVFWGKAADRWLVGEYEREAIRSHVFSRFEDMLVATASHPAMLFYLDNWQSSVPDSAGPTRPRLALRRQPWERLSPAQRRRLSERRGLSPEQAERVRRQLERARGRRRGINENYARELLELHTLGVDGGYTQEDVREVARAFTGWTIARSDEAIAFRFRPELHDSGAKRVLGRPLEGGVGADGMREGRELLHLLATHPSTARHLATKLAVAFVSDDPPPALVDELAAVFRETGGDLREVTRALFSSDAFYDPALYGAKLKSPFELVSSALRTTGAEVGSSRALVQRLRTFGQLPYLNPVPTGYAEEAEEWASSGAMLQRMNFALELAAGRLDHVRVRSPAPDAPPSALVEGLLQAHLPGFDTEALRAAILAETAEGTERGEGFARRALGLILGSPEFQRH